MKPVYVVTYQATPETIAHLRAKSVSTLAAQTADLMARPMTQQYRTKRAADKLVAELTESGMWTVSVRVLQRAESLEEAFMHLIGVPA